MVLNVCFSCPTRLKTAIQHMSLYSPRIVVSAQMTLCFPQKACFFGSAQRHMATEREKKRRTLSEEELRARRQAKNEANEKFPFLLRKRIKNVYVLNTSLAGEIAKAVASNQSEPDTPVIELNPGIGVLTTALIKAGVKHVILAESMKDFMPYLKDVQKKFENNILGLYNLDYLYRWKKIQTEKCTEREFEDSIGALIPERKITDSPPVSFVAILPRLKERTFINYVMMCAVRQQGIHSLGRPEYFLAISPILHKKILAVNMEECPKGLHSHLAIVLNIVFDIRLCAQLPGWMFTPAFAEKIRKTTVHQLPEISDSMRYLVRLQPRAQPQIPLKQVPSFYIFLAQLLRIRKARLILKMEQLVPGCGVRLIAMHFTMMTTVGDVSMSQFVTIFKELQTWPELESSPLRQIMNDPSFSTADSFN